MHQLQAELLNKILVKKCYWFNRICRSSSEILKLSISVILYSHDRPEYIMYFLYLNIKEYQYEYMAIYQTRSLI